MIFTLLEFYYIKKIKKANRNYCIVSYLIFSKDTITQIKEFLYLRDVIHSIKVIKYFFNSLRTTIYKLTFTLSEKHI